MKNALIIHGMPLKDMYYDPATASPSNYHWIPWLQKQLNLRDILTQTPEMSQPYAPDYDSWKTLFERFEINPETILVGHSGGAGFLARWLSEQTDAHVGQVLLVAPWLDLAHERTGAFFQFELDPDFVSRTASTTIVYSDNDDAIIQDSVTKLKTVTEIQLKELHGLGHFSHWDMPNPEFPQLLTELGLE